jgi:hypothetical protein
MNEIQVQRSWINITNSAKNVKDEYLTRRGNFSYIVTISKKVNRKDPIAGVVKLGRRRGLKIPRTQVHESSILSPGTLKQSAFSGQQSAFSIQRPEGM